MSVAHAIAARTDIQPSLPSQPIVPAGQIPFDHAAWLAEQAAMRRPSGRTLSNQRKQRVARRLQLTNISNDLRAWLGKYSADQSRKEEFQQKLAQLRDIEGQLKQMEQEAWDRARAAGHSRDPYYGPFPLEGFDKLPRRMQNIILQIQDPQGWKQKKRKTHWQIHVKALVAEGHSGQELTTELIKRDYRVGVPTGLENDDLCDDDRFSLTELGEAVLAQMERGAE